VAIILQRYEWGGLHSATSMAAAQFDSDIPAGELTVVEDAPRVGDESVAVRVDAFLGLPLSGTMIIARS
jgi:hypothetical protein